MTGAYAAGCSGLCISQQPCMRVSMASIVLLLSALEKEVYIENP